MLYDITVTRRSPPLIFPASVTKVKVESEEAALIPNQWTTQLVNRDGSVEEQTKEIRNVKAKLKSLVRES